MNTKSVVHMWNTATVLNEKKTNPVFMQTCALVYRKTTVFSIDNIFPFLYLPKHLSDVKNWAAY